VVLDRDIREDDAESTINALKQIKGVISVVPNVANIEETIAYRRLQNEYREKLFKLFEDD
jgi:uncharacterized protein (DUF1499 family)